MVGPLIQPIELLGAAPVEGDGVIGNGGLRRGGTPDRDSDANPDLDAKDVVRRTAQLRVLADVALKVEVVDGCEVLRQMLAHSVEGNLLYEAVV